MTAVRVTNLVKEFHRPSGGGFFRSLFGGRAAVRAVDDISFEVEPGEVIGYLGPNGAGKSTTIKMLTGILVPTSGEVQVSGVVPYRDRRRNSRNIGVVFGQRTQLWYDLPLRHSLEAIRDLYRVPAADYRQRLRTFDDLLGIGEFLQTPVRSLSLGQRMRGDLVAAMLYRPAVLYLDEPTVGLDVVAKAALRTFIAETNAADETTIMLTTHDMDDVERLCRRVMIIDSGRILYDGGLAALKKQYVPYRELLITPADPADAARIDSPLAVRAGERDGVVTLRFDPDQVGTPAVIASVTAAFEVQELSIVDPDLEDVVHRLYGERPQP
ncbi:ATP-binding cassette domain-containing protein [Microlunatus sp. GCM10028923]|uniref:ABC transporter ATP-binding protein n=1 Tax=Microlunatus sp. GCM10028923 TaxID=3273400 RepID=UPI00360EFF27